MSNIEHVEIVKHIPFDELESLWDSVESMDGLTSVEKRRMAERLSFVRLRYKGYSVAEAADILGVNRQSGYNWQKSWNEKGFEGLKPDFDGGAPSKLTDVQKKDLVSYVSSREMCTDSVVDYVKMAYSIEYSETQISRILKKGGLVYRRGYKVDYRRPSDPEEILKKTSDWCWMRPEQTT